MAGDGDGAEGVGLGSLTEAQIATLDTNLQKAIKMEQKFKEIAESVDSYSEALRRGYEIQIKTVQEFEKQVREAKNLTDLLEVTQTLSTSNSELMEKMNEIQQQMSEGKIDEVTAQRELIRLAEEDRALTEVKQRASQKTDQFMGGIASKLGIANEFSKTTVGRFADMAANLSKSGAAGEILNESLRTILSPANLAASLLEKMYESVIAVALGLDSANSAFQRTTGFANDFKGTMTKVAQAGLLSGVTIDDAQKSMGALVTNFSAFNPAAETTNAALGETISLLSKTGVSADQSAKTMDFFNKVLGESPKAAADLTREIAMAGTQIGISTSKMLSDFEKLNGYLVGFGPRATSIFKELQAQAKTTGIEISKLVEITKKFDSFDGAAKAVGSLNAVLGTNLSSIDMINASSEQRISMLSQEIMAATGGFKNLDRYTQMYVAQAIGVSDLGEAERLLNLARDPKQMADYNSKMQASAARQEELKELTESFVPVMEQFKIAVLGLGLALEPVLNLVAAFFKNIGNVVSNIFKLNDAMQGLLIPGLGAVAAVMIVAKMTTLGFASAVKMAAGSTGLGLLLIVSTLLVNAFPEFADAISALTMGVFLLGLAWKFTGGWMWAISSAFIMLLTIFGTKINPLFIQAFAFMAVGVFLLGLAFRTIKGPALGAAIVIAIIAASAALLIYSMKDLFAMFADNIGTLVTVAGSLITLGIAFTYFGAGVLLGASALAMATYPLIIITGLMMMMEPVMQSLGDSFEKIGNGFALIGAGMLQIVQGLDAISAFKDDGEFFAISTDGSKTSMISAKGGILTNFTSENITVDVKIPEIKIPQPIVQVFIDGKELKIERAVQKIIGGASGG